MEALYNILTPAKVFRMMKDRQTGERLCSDYRIRLRVHAVVIGGMKDELCLTIEEIPHL